MKRKILIVAPYFLPGFKSGGILRTILNTIDWLSDKYEFLILTRDRDLGDSVPYPTVVTGTWVQVGCAKVLYLAPRDLGIRSLRKVIASVDYDVLHLNSFFDWRLILPILILVRLRLVPLRRTIVAPRGEFVYGPYHLKFPRKILFVTLLRALGLYRNLVWHASSPLETKDIRRVVGQRNVSVHEALDLPTKWETPKGILGHADSSILRLVFLSRITREKNLDYALRVLTSVHRSIVFDIFGTVGDASYWAECLSLIARLPSNVQCRFHGPVDPSSVLSVFQNYDCFFFPTQGENYGHVIAESLTVGTRVLISNRTIWKDLEKDGFGWDLPLATPGHMVACIESMQVDDRESTLSREERADAFARRIQSGKTLQQNRALFS